MSKHYTSGTAVVFTVALPGDKHMNLINAVVIAADLSNTRVSSVVIGSGSFYCHDSFVCLHSFEEANG